MGGISWRIREAFKSGQKKSKPIYKYEQHGLSEPDNDRILSSPRMHLDTVDPEPSCENPPHDSFPEGVKAWHECPDAKIDICFVHGLTGDRDRTWTANGQSIPWPKDLLPAKLPKARILTYGYDAYIMRRPVASSNRLIDHATNLINDLTTDRASCNASSRPLIFVTHSLGGLVCKEATLLSRNNPEVHLREIFDHTKGIMFMGTPHKGSWMADWAIIPASIFSISKSTNKRLLEILETDQQLLESIQVRFWSMIRELREAGRGIEVVCFFEELPLPLVGKVVSKESATLEGYGSISIHANHSDMVRFASAEENGFKRVLGELARWESQITDSIATQSIPPMNESPSEELVKSSFNNYGTGIQFNSSGGTQNNNMGKGSLLSGTIFHGSVYFG
jgi:protein SERAC1